jgi:hypothetical protein
MAGGPSKTMRSAEMNRHTASRGARINTAFSTRKPLASAQDLAKAPQRVKRDLYQRDRQFQQHGMAPCV